MRVVTAPMDPSDEDLMQALASGREEAVGPLYARYAPSGPAPQVRTTLLEYLEKEPGYRETAIRLITDKLKRP